MRISYELASLNLTFSFYLLLLHVSDAPLRIVSCIALTGLC